MSDVVGTAYVRIKALTDKLAKDIKDDVTKSMKKANLDKVAQEQGEDFGEEFGDSVADSSEKTLKKRAKDIVPKDELNKEFDGVVKDVEKTFRQMDLGDAFDQLNGDFRENFTQLEIEFPEIDDVEFNVNADTDPATNSLLALQNRVRELDLELPEFDFTEFDRSASGIIIDVDTSRVENAFDLLQRKFAEIRSRARSGPPLQFVDVDFDGSFRKSLELDSDAMRRMGDRFREIREEFGDGFDIPPISLPFDEGRFRNFFRRLKSDFNDSNKDTQGWAGKMRGHFRSLSDDIDNGPLPKALVNIGKKFSSLGGGFNFGILKSKILLIGGAIVAALPYIQDVGSAVLAYATGLVAQIGFLATAMGGLGVAAGAALGATALAALPIVLAFKAETEELLTFKDSLAEAGEEFQNIGVATQQTLLPALDEALDTIQDIIPQFSEFGFFVGRSVGDFAKLAANTLTGSKATGRFQEIMQSSLRILDRLFPTLLNVGDLLSGIWVAALPAAERFVGIIEDLTGKWAGMVNEGLRTGELTAKFDLWFDRAVMLGSALGDLTRALGNILSVGANSAGGVFERFDAWAERFRAFTESESGQNRLALIFDNALAVMKEINGIAADLFDGIFGRLGDVGGVDSMVEALQRFRDIIPEIQEFWGSAYTNIKRVAEIFASNVWEKMTQAWEQMADPLGRLATQMLELLEVMSDSGAFEVFLDLMEILADVLATLLAIPGFGQFVAYFLAFSSAIKITGLVLGPFVAVFGPFVGLIGKLLALKAASGLAATAGAFAKIADGAKLVSQAKIAGTLASATPAVKAAATSAGGLATKITAVGKGLSTLGVPGLIAGAAIATVGTAFFLHKKAAQEFDQDVRQATEALGLLNEGLNITAEGVAKYVKEQSRFEGNDQIDDLTRMGLTVAELGEQVAAGSLTYEAFANKALLAGEVFVEVDKSMSGGGYTKTRQSLESLAQQYDLTSEQVEKLAKGEEVRANGVSLSIEGNDSLLESYEELRNVIGAAAKENIDAFVLNAQNVRLLGNAFLNDLKSEIDSTEDGDAAQVMAGGQEALAAAAVKSSAAIKGLSEATREQIREQVTLADGTVDVVRENELLYNAQQKLFRQIRSDLELFASIGVGDPFEPARASAVQFSLLVNEMDFTAFKDLANNGDIDALQQKFPDLAHATDDLFRKLETLPEEEFHAFATSLNLDAESLKAAMAGANQAIQDLQDQALSTLPTVGSLLDDAIRADEEDGEKHFDSEGFTRAIKERITQTTNFADDIGRIKTDISEEAARLAAREGPEAAAHLVKMIGHDPEGLATAIDAMEASEEALRVQIETVLGPGIKLEYLAMAEPLSEGFGIGLANGINSPATLEALKGSGTKSLNYLARGFQGKFIIDGNTLKFIHTGRFGSTDRLTPGQRRQLEFGAATGGFVEQSGIGGTFSKVFPSDTVRAWLTPGEFVNTAATVDRLGVDFFHALNKGETPAVPVPVGGGGINANGWTIVAPTPEESARQMVARFRSLSFLTGGG